MRLHELTKPVRKPEVYEDDLPSLNTDDDSEWDSDLPEDMSDASGDEFSDDEDGDNVASDYSNDSNEEMPYETIPRKPRAQSSEPTEVHRLPIKLANGKIQKTGMKAASIKTPQRPVEEDDDDSEEEDEEYEEEQKVEDVATGARFGRPAVVDVLSTKSRRQRVGMAKDQIAGICQEIMADPENSVKLHLISLPNPC